MKIRYQLSEQRSAEGTVTIDEDVEHDYLTARNVRERREAVEAAVMRHADEQKTWTDDWTVGFEVVTTDEEDND